MKAKPSKTTRLATHLMLKAAVKKLRTRGEEPSGLAMVCSVMVTYHSEIAALIAALVWIILRVHI
jgi:hypothetical protein